jgi:plastocyanin
VSALPAIAANSSAQIISCTGASGCFTPNPIRIKVGDTVTWTNSSGITHTSTSDSGAWDTGDVPNGATSAAVTFSVQGSFSYHCTIHPTMTGTVIVSAVAATPASPRPGVRRLAAGGGQQALTLVAGLLVLGLGLLVLQARGARPVAERTPTVRRP